MASMEREQRALIKWCRETSSRYLGCKEQIRDMSCCWKKQKCFRDFCVCTGLGTYCELSKSLDKILEMMGRSVITAVVSTCLGSTQRLFILLPAPITGIDDQYELASSLTVLGPSTARPGFRAPPGPGFSPRIHTRCLRKTERSFSV